MKYFFIMTKTDVKSSAWSIAFYKQVLQRLKYPLEEEKHYQFSLAGT